MSIARRLRVAMAVVIVVLLAALGATTWGLVQLRDLADRIQQVDVPLQHDSAALLTALVNEETGLRGFLLTRDGAFLQPLQSGRSQYAELLQGIDSLDTSATVDTDLSNVQARVNDWRTQYEDVELAAAPDTAAQEVADTVVGKQLFDRVRAALTTLSSSIDALTNHDFAATKDIRARVFLSSFGAALFGTALAVLVLVLTARTILRPMASLREIARAMNEGRPAGSAPPPTPPELRDVYDAIVGAGAALQDRERELATANQELADASRSKSDFLATMSHELRTPLNAILGFTDLVRSGATGEVTPQTADYLERVRRNGSVLLELINDVLDLSKIEAGRMAVNLGVVTVDEVARRVIANVQSLADGAGITLELKTAGAGETLAWSDPRALSQILTNLVGNAVKFTREGSVKVEIREAGGEAIIEVVDTGPGIHPDEQVAIFEPFRQVGAHARTGTGGTGLGLAISVRLARLMGGDISLASRPGVGSRFTVRLPAARGPHLHPAAGSATGAVVLAIDDDPDSLSLWQAQLEPMGFGFVGVQESASAVSVAASLKPAAILLDIVFPLASGWDVLDALHADPRTADIPVVVVSVVDGEERARAASVRFLQKPVSQEQLRAALEQYLGEPTEVLA